ncbi:MAG TPA: NAD(P)-binding domain-containing protein [Syntrophorhabdaceae bacterium]|nr:NAD(P)-binding domain-containing protein [Syntrophorhabdaceae bacterium]
MKQIGFIGFGHMAEALVRSLLTRKPILAKDLVVSNRSRSKLRKIKADFPTLAVTTSNIQVARKADIIFICVNTHEVIQVMKEILSSLDNTKHLVIISGGLEIMSVEHLFNGKISKLIPTLTCEVFQGASLLCHNRLVLEKDKKYIANLLKTIGRIELIEEDQFAVYTVLSSCAPGLIAAIFEQFIRSAVKHDKIDYRTCFEIVLSSLLGTSLLLSKKGEGFNNLIGRVARKGGNTEIAVNIFENKLPRVYDELFGKIIKNETRRNDFTRKQFGIPSKSKMVGARGFEPSLMDIT